MAEIIILPTLIEEPEDFTPEEKRKLLLKESTVSKQEAFIYNFYFKVRQSALNALSGQTFQIQQGENWEEITDKLKKVHEVWNKYGGLIEMAENGLNELLINKKELLEELIK
jgi:dissimilatory sulfite reductase (desulfoviridin) alpha/beta subunit